MRYYKVYIYIYMVVNYPIDIRIPVNGIKMGFELNKEYIYVYI